MSQLPTDPSGARGNENATRGQGARHTFWLSGIGGFVLGALTVIIVLLLTRRAGDLKEPGAEARPQRTAVQPAVQNDTPTDTAPAH